MDKFLLKKSLCSLIFSRALLAAGVPHRLVLLGGRRRFLSTGIWSVDSTPHQAPSQAPSWQHSQWLWSSVFGLCCHRSNCSYFTRNHLQCSRFSHLNMTRALQMWAIQENDSMNWEMPVILPPQLITHHPQMYCAPSVVNQRYNQVNFFNLWVVSVFHLNFCWQSFLPGRGDFGFDFCIVFLQFPLL